jgi:hypothetical protein
MYWHLYHDFMFDQSTRPINFINKVMIRSLFISQTVGWNIGLSNAYVILWIILEQLHWRWILFDSLDSKWSCLIVSRIWRSWTRLLLCESSQRTLQFVESPITRVVGLVEQNKMISIVGLGNANPATSHQLLVKIFIHSSLQTTWHCSKLLYECNETSKCYCVLGMSTTTSLIPQNKLGLLMGNACDLDPPDSFIHIVSYHHYKKPEEHNWLSSQHFSQNQGAGRTVEILRSNRYAC